jgi:hypothetical protein|tara:strand:+ start:362 stop:778 length:417 start_codon:yes stop_codon:yes gene_type:complete
MATTTAAVTLTSDLLSNAMSLSTTTTCMKAGTTADGLNQMDTGYVEIATGDVYDILDATVLGLDKANKVYICNESTDETFFVDVTVKAEVIGSLYAGDWMFIPWGAEHADSDIGLEAKTGTNKITYTLFHEGRTLTAS